MAVPVVTTGNPLKVAHLRGPFQRVELPCNGNIYPGQLVQEAAGGVVVHSTAGGFAELMFAEDDGLEGTDYETQYTAGIGNIPLSIEQRGNLVNVVLLAGSNYTAGTKLISDGAGNLKPTTGSPSQIIAVIPAAYAINLSASGTGNTLCPVRIL